MNLQPPAVDVYYRSNYRYDPLTGFVTRKGRVVTAKTSEGYIKIDTRPYGIIRAHRVAWFLYHGTWPNGEIHHINGIKHDNRLVNLEDVTHQRNIELGWRHNGDQDASIRINRHGGHYQVRVKVNGHRIAKTFRTIEAARKFRDELYSRQDKGLTP